MKKIRFMDTSFRDGFQSVLGARVRTEDFLPALEAAAEAGIESFEIGGGARFQSLYFYCQEDAFQMMQSCRDAVGPDINLQTLARGANVVGLVSQCRDIIELHAKLFKKYGVSTIRNFDALNDVRNLDFSGRCIHKYGLKHQVSVTMMGLPPGIKNEDYAHTSKFYADTLKQIMEADIPFDSVCFKDASGTSTPQTVFETIKLARDMVDKDIDIQFHSHCTAGSGSNCLMAAIEAGADVIDLAMSPVSGGTGHTDILTMWHLLRGTDYTIDIDYEKIFLAEEKFKDCMSKYFMGMEAKETSPLIVLSPMPGGALTANTQMMRDNNCMNLYNDVIHAMQEVVARGGFGTSVTPVSQFYFQQAFQNVMSEQAGKSKWEKIVDGYGKMVLGYFGKTPAKPDPEIVKLAQKELDMEPTSEDVHDINDRNPELGIEPAKKMLEENKLETTEENIFITATCGQKGLDFLQGNAPLMIRLKEDEEKKQAETILKEHKDFASELCDRLGFKADTGKSAEGEPAAYTITVNGASYHVDVAPAAPGDAPQITNVQPASPAPQAVTPQQGGAAPATEQSATEQTDITAPMPGTVQEVVVDVGDQLEDGDVVVVIEAMKMEQAVRSTVSGKVISVEVAPKDTVEAGQVIAVVG